MQGQLELGFDANRAQATEKVQFGKISIGKHRVGATPVFAAYWRFAAERQNIFFRRLAGKNISTTDEILSRFKFTNTYRASDRVSQFLVRNVIYRQDLPADPTNVFFRILLFKLFNRIETWNHLEQQIGVVCWEDYDFDRYDQLLSRRMAQGERLYSAAYIMPSAGGVYGHPRKHQNHLRLIEHLIEQEYPARIADSSTMAELYQLLLAAPSIGPFLAYQYATDLNYSELVDFSESEFVVAGPGALDGISKCFVGADDIAPADIIRHMHEEQEYYFTHLGIEFPRLWGRPLQLIDCQNIFCEISKYARVAFPDYAGSAGRTRIKQKFTPTGTLPSPWYPPKWGINSAIAHDIQGPADQPALQQYTRHRQDRRRIQA